MPASISKRPPKGTACIICGRTIGKKAPIRFDERGWRHRDDCTSGAVPNLRGEIEFMTGYRTSLRQTLKNI